LLCFALVCTHVGGPLAAAATDGSSAMTGSGSAVIVGSSAMTGSGSAAIVGSSAVAASAPIDEAEQLAINEAAKELFTLKQVRELARSAGGETLKAKADLAIAQASKEAADMAVSDAWYALHSSAAALAAARSAAEAGGPAGALAAAPEIAAASQMAAAAEAAIAGAGAALENALLSLDDAKATLESQKEVAAYTGEELFFAYLQLNDSLAMLDKTVEFSRSQIKIEELKATMGLSTDTEVQKKRLALAELGEARQGLLNAIDLTGRSLMRQLGKADGTAFRLDPAYSIEGLKTEYDPDQLASTTVKNNLMLGVLERTIDKMKDSANSNMAASQRNQLGAQADSLMLTRDNTIQAMRLLARTTATGLDTARANMALLETKIADKQASYSVMALQVSLGLAPRIGLAASELELLAAQNEMKKAKQDYYLSLRKAALLVEGTAITSR
jgi:outer membrane protein TolC